MPVDIRIVENKKDLKTFVKVPFSIYKNDPYWVPPLIVEEMDTFNPAKNPSYELADARLFVAYRDNKPVGRVAAILNHAANKKYNTKNMRFGWFESIEDYEVTVALLDTVEDWARETGMETMSGPHGFTDLDPEGMLVEGFDQLPTLAVFYNYSYYPEFMDNYGFQKDVDYIEFKSEISHETGVPEKLARLVERIRERSNLNVLQLRSRKDVLKWGPPVMELIDETYKEIYGAVPLTQTLIQYYVDKYLSYIDPNLIKVVTNGDNQLVGVMITMPSLSRAFQKAKGRLFPFGWYHLLRGLKQRETIDFYLAGIKEKYRGKGVDLLMVVELLKTILDKGFKYTESNPELETNTKIHAQWKHFNPEQHKRRRIYKKNIGTN